ncbi:hypothetical protein Bbelb_411190 [Branchiostoma belcheri]|nr:hypothetical protein Bbelb_446700 [Branchiostoma belcheri]KAI8481176.1 hypothetical protein Bbelb_411190 [Branchiostoma belcheri]
MTVDGLCVREGDRSIFGTGDVVKPFAALEQRRVYSGTVDGIFTARWFGRNICVCTSPVCQFLALAFAGERCEGFTQIHPFLSYLQHWQKTERRKSLALHIWHAWCRFYIVNKSHLANGAFPTCSRGEGASLLEPQP